MAYMIYETRKTILHTNVDSYMAADGCLVYNGKNYSWDKVHGLHFLERSDGHIQGTITVEGKKIPINTYTATKFLGKPYNNKVELGIWLRDVIQRLPTECQFSIGSNLSKVTGFVFLGFSVFVLIAVGISVVVNNLTVSGRSYGQIAMVIALAGIGWRMSKKPGFTVMNRKDFELFIDKVMV